MSLHHRADFRSVIIPFIIFTGIWGSTWIVIRDQLGVVPGQWSVAYRFMIAAAAMAMVAKWKGQSFRLGRHGLFAAVVLGFAQFCANFNAVYLAERHITSGLVATVFALLIIPNTLLAWAFLGQRPNSRFVWSSLGAFVGISMLFAHELREHPARVDSILLGISLTLVGLIACSAANVYQAREKVREHSLFALLALAMAAGAVIDAVLAFVVAGPPVIEARLGYWIGLAYLGLAASALAFSLYFPVVRKIGPGKAAYSSVVVPIIAMGFSTWIEDYRWNPLAATGALLALGGMLGALSRGRQVVPSPDAA